ncbi:22981_t:CDS:2, partial [Racocetra persica]
MGVIWKIATFKNNISRSSNRRASQPQITTPPGVVTTPSYSQTNPTSVTASATTHGVVPNGGIQNNSPSESISPGLIVGLGIAGILVVGLIAFFVRKRLKALNYNKHRSFLNDDFNEMFNVGSTEQHTANSNANSGNTRNLNSSASRSRTNNDRRVQNADPNINRSNSRPLNNMTSSPTNLPLTNNNRGGERAHMASRMNNNRGGGGVYNSNNSGSNRPWPNNHRGGEGVHNFNNRSNDISIINNRVNVSSPLASPPLTSMSNAYSNKVSEVTTPYHPAISVEQPSFGRPPPLGTPYVHGVSSPPPPTLLPENNNMVGYGAEIRSNNINIIPSSSHQQYQQYNSAGINTLPPHNYYNVKNDPTFSKSNNGQFVTSDESREPSNVNRNITVNRVEGIPLRANTLGGKSFGSFDYGDY